MRARLVMTLAIALLAASCGELSETFSTPTATPPVSSPEAASTTAKGTTTVATGAAETTSTAAAVAAWAWSPVAPDGSIFGGPEDQDLAAVTTGGPGLVAVGSDFTGGDFDAAVWTSPDGLTWSRVPHDEVVFGGPGYQRMWGVAAGGPGVVAVGFAESEEDWDAAVWVSADGLAWSRVPHDTAVLGGPERQVMNRVVAAGPGLVASGYDASGGDFDLALWVSADGLAWSRVPHDEAVFGGPDDQRAQALLAGAGGLVAAGFDYSGGDADLAVWLSADGLAWSRLPHDEAVFGGPDAQAANGLVAGPAGLVAVGFDRSQSDPDAAVWVSADGFAWSRVPHDEVAFGGPGDQGMAAVAFAGGGLVVLGYDYGEGDGDLAVWTSPDGLAWSRVPHDEAVFGGPGDQRPWQVLAGGPGLVAVGLNDTGADRNGLMWIAVPAG